jgi:hypothetical protein
MVIGSVNQGDMHGPMPQRLGGREATKSSSDYHNPWKAVNPVTSNGILALRRTVSRGRRTAACTVRIACPSRDWLTALDSVFHSEKHYRSDGPVSIEPSTESQMSQQR